MDNCIDRSDVLERDELPIMDASNPVKSKDKVRIEGEWGNNFYWHGEKCYVPVIYRGQKYKKRIFIKSAIIDDI